MIVLLAAVGLLSGSGALSLPPPAALQQAHSAFEQGDYASVEVLATSAATEPSQAGEALNLLGVARFRAGDAARALLAFDEAGHASKPPAAATWHYDRASCLYELGRFAEAEAEYVLAAELDAALSLPALVNAGFAALDGGAMERARTLARRARETIGPGGALDLVLDLEQHLSAQSEPAVSKPSEYAAGLAAYDAGLLQDAREHFRQAITAAPADGRSRIMAGATALRLGDREEARVELTTALGLQLEPADRTIAGDYLATMSHGLAVRGRGWDFAARLGAGFDTNFFQSGPVAFSTVSTDATPSAIATATLVGGWRARPANKLFTEVSYGLDQQAYLSSAAADYSVQLHTLTGVAEFSARDWLRFGLGASAQLDFVGLSSFRILQTGGGVRGWVGLDEHELTTTRLGLEWSGDVAPLSEFEYLQGHKAGASLAQTLRLGLFSAELEYRFRYEGLGTLSQSVELPLPPLICGPDCTEKFVIPFGYLSHTVGLSLRMTLASIAHIGLAAGVESRGYLADSYLELSSSEGTTALDRRRRTDTRLFGSLFGDVRIWRGLELSLRYDVVANQSNIDDSIREGLSEGCHPPDFVCHQFDYDNKNYTKHVLLFEAGYVW